MQIFGQDARIFSKHNDWYLSVNGKQPPEKQLTEKLLTDTSSIGQQSAQY